MRDSKLSLIPNSILAYDKQVTLSIFSGTIPLQIKNPQSAHIISQLIINFWYGFKNDIMKGRDTNKTSDEYIKYFALTPDNHRTINPLNPIKIEVPRSG